jgi:hypothetical protein
MLAAEQDQAEQELPKSICQPRHVRLSVLVLNAGSLQHVEMGKTVFFSENSEAGRSSSPAEAMLAE